MAVPDSSIDEQCGGGRVGHALDLWPGFDIVHDRLDCASARLSSSMGAPMVTTIHGFFGAGILPALSKIRRLVFDLRCRTTCPRSTTWRRSTTASTCPSSSFGCRHRRRASRRLRPDPPRQGNRDRAEIARLANQRLRDLRNIRMPHAPSASALDSDRVPSTAARSGRGARRCWPLHRCCCIRFPFRRAVRALGRQGHEAYGATPSSPTGAGRCTSSSTRASPGSRMTDAAEAVPASRAAALRRAWSRCVPRALRRRAHGQDNIDVYKKLLEQQIYG